MESTQGSSSRGTLELIVQLVTAGAVLAGLYLVMVELQQAREISTLQLVQGRLDSTIEHHSRIYGENLADTLAKACRYPDELNDSEVVALNYFFANQMNQIQRTRLIAVIGTFQKGLGLVENWELLSRQYMGNILQYPSGVQWLETEQYYGNPEVAKIDEVAAFAQSFLAKPPFRDCNDHWKRVKPGV